jgi:hypothetical protein
MKKLCETPCISVKLCVTKNYTEAHRVFTEKHREKNAKLKIMNRKIKINKNLSYSPLWGVRGAKKN